MAEEQHKRNCTMFDTETPLSTIGNDAATGENPADHPRNSAEETPINLSSMIDPAPLFGGSGGCPSNVTVGNYVLPFSRLCDYLPMVRAALLGFAYLVAAFIVFRR
ncbi:hypothetical protein M8A51_20485 [Schlegelella sp. S2-27]|uniref:Uncharacterized protein n=1 Tax=Caldimonas mangrovi TaxID=2944811 RepID=A0ABT0YTF6_9BURK|nr:virulence factor TspB C-terminal domain-related protein [Caldimonas mangrovi]MCM5681913.1 hypothetical protein [Caldimonas mangrovi]